MYNKSGCSFLARTWQPSPTTPDSTPKGVITRFRVRIRLVLTSNFNIMNTLYRFLITIPFLVLATSCEKFLDRDPLDQAAENTFWNTEEDAIAGVNAVYTALPDARDFWRDCHSDNSVMTNAWGEGGLGYISMGSHTAADGYISEEWRYDLIRRALYALGQLSGMEIDGELKQRLISEVRFILAMRYFRMTQLFGDIPLIKEEPIALDEADLLRAPRAEVLAYAIENVDTRSEEHTSELQSLMR